MPEVQAIRLESRVVNHSIVVYGNKDGVLVDVLRPIDHSLIRNEKIG